MRKTDLHPDLQKTAVPVPGRGGVFAVVPKPIPHRIDIDGSEFLFATASQEMERLKEALAGYPHATTLMRMLNRREAVDSSQIEGTSTGYDDLEIYELESAPDTGNEQKKDAADTFAYVTAFSNAQNWIRQKGMQGLTLEMLQVAHHTLMAGSPEKSPGSIRDRQNYIGRSFADARFIPPPPDVVPRLLNDFVQFLQWDYDTEMPQSILMRTAIAHVQFEAIHPFLDGNGRLGRMLLPLMFEADDQIPIHLASFLKLRKDEYYDALIASQMKLNWKPWLTLYLECVIASCRHTRALVSNCQALRLRWSEEYKAARRHAAIHKVLDTLLGFPYVTATTLASQINVSFPAAKNAIDQLVHGGTLRLCDNKINGSSAYYAHEVVNILMTGLDAVLEAVQSPRPW